MEERTYNEMAGVADSPIGTGRARLARARKLLRSDLQRETAGA